MKHSSRSLATLIQIFLFSALFFSPEIQAKCNGKRGYISEQPAPPLELFAIHSTNSSDNNASLGGHADDTLLLDLSKDIHSLIGFTGPNTDSVPILGVRFENVPGFDPQRHCNKIIPIVYKPRIELIEAGQTAQASVDNGRFKHTFALGKYAQPIIQDEDASGQFFWIFPASFGGGSKPWKLTTSYDEAFQSHPTGSMQRRWTAEAYLTLAMRLYRHRQLSADYPKGALPTKSQLQDHFLKTLGAGCADTSTELVCLASTLIELNEAAPPDHRISPDAFRVGDALFWNSGVTAGIRQLDFGTNNDQANLMVAELFPTTLGRDHKGRGYRRPYRQWSIHELNAWYERDGPAANDELSRREAKDLLLSSHATFLRDAAERWLQKVEMAYPEWTPKKQKTLAMIAIDLENVSGHRLTLTPSAADICVVLTDDTLSSSRRSNASVAVDQAIRLKNASIVASQSLNYSEFEYPC